MSAFRLQPHLLSLRSTALPNPPSTVLLWVRYVDANLHTELRDHLGPPLLPFVQYLEATQSRPNPLPARPAPPPPSFNGAPLTDVDEEDVRRTSPRGPNAIFETFPSRQVRQQTHGVACTVASRCKAGRHLGFPYTEGPPGQETTRCTGALTEPPCWD